MTQEWIHISLIYHMTSTILAKGKNPHPEKC